MSATPRRTAALRRYAMCPPMHFEVSYAINPWMDPSTPVDQQLALAQWQALRDAYEGLGHVVDLIPPQPGLPDMVFAANGGLVVDGRALGVRFATPQRAPEAEHFLDWLRAHGHPDAVPPAHVNEGEGDFLVAGDVILAGTGYRTHPLAHAEVASHFGREVLTLELVHPSYYHLDTAMCVLDDTTIAYLPEAFSAPSREVLAERFPGAILVDASDAAVLGLNAVSDGRHVVLNVEASGFAAQLEAAGFVPVPVDLSELRKAGGGPKCCTLELRPASALDEEISA
jgi:N-dimethylarginine dimethylaminohydrolase